MVQTTVSTLWVLPLFQNLSYKLLLRRLSGVLAVHSPNEIKENVIQTFFKLSGGYYTKTSYATFFKEWHRPMSKQLIKYSYSIPRATSIDSDSCSLLKASVLRNKADKIMLQTVLIISQSFSNPQFMHKKVTF